MLPTDRTPIQKGILPAKGAFFHINHVYITARSTSTKDNPFPTQRQPAKANPALLALFSSGCRHKVIRSLHQFADQAVRDILLEIDADPIFFVHVPTGTDPHVASLQLSRPVGVAFDTAKIENRDIHETKPFVPDIKTEHIPAIPIGNIRKRHFSRTPLNERQYSLNSSTFIRTTPLKPPYSRRNLPDEAAPETPCKTGPDRPE